MFSTPLDYTIYIKSWNSRHVDVKITGWDEEVGTYFFGLYGQLGFCMHLTLRVEETRIQEAATWWLLLWFMTKSAAAALTTRIFACHQKQNHGILASAKDYWEPFGR